MYQETTVPNSKESEMMVLGSMLTNSSALNICANLLDKVDFYFIEHRTIFEVLKALHTSNKPADIHLVAEELKNQGNLKKVGGVVYLVSLAQYVGTSAYVEEYVDLVREKSILRKLLETGHNLEKTALSNPSNVQVEIDLFQKELEGIKQNKLKPEALYGHLLLPTSEREICEEMNQTSPGIRVGFTLGKIDLKIPGGAITVVAGPTGHGKTLLTINFALNYLSLHEDKKVFFLSFEESRAAILSLFLNTYINLDLSNNNRESIKSYFRDNQTTYIAQNKSQEFLRLKETFFRTLIEPGRLNIFYCDYFVEELVAAIRFLKNNTNVGLVVIDYMQLLRQLNKKTTQRQEELKQICLMLKDCAVDTGLPLLLAAQFNRTVVNEATISPVAIGEAGDIERAANMIIGMWNRNYAGFTDEGNIGRCGKKISKESALYLEILKGRETGIGQSAVYDLQGNSGKLSPRNSNDRPDTTDEDGYEHIATINRSN